MAQRDRAAVDVDPLLVEPQPPARPRATGRRRPRSARTGRCRPSSRPAARARSGWRPPGPRPITRGGTPTEALAADRRQRRARRLGAASALITTSAAAPSLIPEEVPAVTVPSLVERRAQAASRSAVVSGRGCSSRVHDHGLAPPLRHADRPRSRRRRSPASIAAAARRWLRRAKASCSARLISSSAATFSAVTPMCTSQTAHHSPSRTMESTSGTSPIRCRRASRTGDAATRSCSPSRPPPAPAPHRRDRLGGQPHGLQARSADLVDRGAGDALGEPAASAACGPGSGRGPPGARCPSAPRSPPPAVDPGPPHRLGHRDGAQLGGGRRPPGRR